MERTVAVFLLSAVMYLYPAMAQQPEECHARPAISVNGDASVYVEPDRAVVVLGIETWNSEILIAKQKNNEILEKVLAAVKELGIPKKDIQTARISLKPKYKERYQMSDDYNKVEGYLARNTLVVTLTEINIMEELVTKALQSGVNYIDGLEFQTTDFKKYRERARELALKAAKEKAEKMAFVLGMSVGDPLHITENQSISGSDFRMSQTRIEYLSDDPDSNSAIVSPGKISIRASVEVVFELKK